MAYNEEANIANAIESILAQKVVTSEIAELIVVASGCEDQTARIVADHARHDPRVKLIEQHRREGKASAINLFLRAGTSPVLALISADVVLEEGALEVLLHHFEDPSVGMVGGHPVPVNSETTLLGHAVQLQWRLHDHIARRSPKLGEMVAFRSVVSSIPLDTAVDELSVQAIVAQLGYRLVYEPAAVVYNRGPATVADFLTQRRRIHAGHLAVRRRDGYPAPTLSILAVAAALLRSSRAFATPRAVLWTLVAAGLEAAARALGRYDALRHRSPHVWKMVKTTKQRIADDMSGYGHQTVVVLQIVNFRRRTLELGLRASRRLTRDVANQAKGTLGAAIAVIEESGTVVAQLACEREEAERAASQLVARLEGEALLDAPITFSCGVIALDQAGARRTSSVQVPALDTAATPKAS